MGSAQLQKIGGGNFKSEIVLHENLILYVVQCIYLCVQHSYSVSHTLYATHTVQFDFSIFASTAHPGCSKLSGSNKYPDIRPNFESISVPGLFFG